MAEPQFQQGEALQWLTIEGGFSSRRMVTLQQIDSETTAIVSFGTERLKVSLTELSRPKPPSHPWFLPAAFTVKPPPTPPTGAQLDERLATARAALGARHQAVRNIQARLDQARAVVERAQREHAQALGALRVYNDHQTAAQAALEECLRLGKPLPVLSNGQDHPRHYLTEKRDMTAAALEKFQSALADQMQAMNEALSAVRKASAEILSLLVQRETEALRRLDVQAAVARAELLAVINHWFGGAELGPIRLPPVSSAYLEAQPAWQDVAEVREGGSESRIRPWRQIFDALVTGEDVEVDFALGD
jgi:hypothetical protein